ncbi:hypothetical protein Pfo_027211 [Paulownia fortunei]|nr:hypothetical protein Pfo_027211 [Paulownia fortunei]
MSVQTTEEMVRGLNLGFPKGRLKMEEEEEEEEEGIRFGFLGRRSLGFWEEEVWDFGKKKKKKKKEKKKVGSGGYGAAVGQLDSAAVAAISCGGNGTVSSSKGEERKKITNIFKLIKF